MQVPDKKETARVHPDGRRQLLVYLPPELIKDIKKLAVDDDTTASAIVEEALRQWVEKRPTDNRGERATK
jgi:predicted transcriptional regulator